jgi:hypothetical protein
MIRCIEGPKSISIYEIGEKTPQKIMKVTLQ